METRQATARAGWRGEEEKRLAAVRASWESEQQQKLLSAQAAWRAEEQERLAAAQDNWYAELQGQLEAAKRKWELEIEDRLARARAERGEAGADRHVSQDDVAPGGASGPDEDLLAPDAEAIARNAIEEVKREAEEAKHSLDERRHQAKLEGRRVADKRHRKATRGMKEKAVNYQARHSSTKLILAIAAVVMIGAAAFVGTQDLSPLEQAIQGLRALAPK